MHACMYVCMHACMYVQVIKALNARIGEETTKNAALKKVYEERIAALQAEVCLRARGGCERVCSLLSGPLIPYREYHVCGLIGSPSPSSSLSLSVLSPAPDYLAIAPAPAYGLIVSLSRSLAVPCECDALALCCF